MTQEVGRIENGHMEGAGKAGTEGVVMPESERV